MALVQGDLGKNEILDPNSQNNEVKDGDNQTLNNEETQPYTNEELLELLESDGVIDRNRLSTEGKAIQQTFEKGYQKKFQKLSRKEKEVEDTRNVKQREPQSIEEWYDMDRAGCLQYINNEIQKATDDEPVKAMKLLKLKTDLLERTSNISASREAARELSNSVFADIRDNYITDFEEKQPLLNQFAEKVLEITPQEQDILTNPAILGPDLARKVVLAINKAYDLLKGTKTVAKKEEKGKMKVESPGGGGTSSNQPSGDLTAAEKDLDAAIETAKKSGKNDDWQRVAHYKRVVNNLKTYGDKAKGG